jgi:hypothetical protein
MQACVLKASSCRGCVHDVIVREHVACNIFTGCEELQTTQLRPVFENLLFTAVLHSLAQLRWSREQTLHSLRLQSSVK